MKRIWVWSFGLFLAGNALGQGAHVQRFPAIPLQGTIHLQSPPPDFKQSLEPVEMPAPAPGTEKANLAARKDFLATQFIPNAHSPGTAFKTNTVPGLQLGNNFNGNTYLNGVPNDNDMAISNGNAIISVVNSNLFVFNQAGTASSNIALSTFSSSLGITAFKFDPKAIYDPDFDRFIVVFLAGSDSTATDIILAFSQTNDPGGSWNLYSLPGNPNNDGTWSDYPMITITPTELFVTVNSVQQDVPWQTGFVQTLIWEVGKDEGFAGDSLPSQMWSGIEYGGKPLRNLCPVKGGASIQGPNMYFLSDRNFAASCDSIFIVEITDTMGAPGQNLVVDMQRSNRSYGVPPRARQDINTFFETNDGRILGAFFQDNQIQFVSNTLDSSTGFCAVYHGTIDDVAGTRTISATILGDSLLDFGYPNISYGGVSPGDDMAAISFNYSSPDSFAGCMAIWYDGAGGYSSPLTVKKGVSYVNMQSGTAWERWGDYSGSQRKYDEPGLVWMNASWGTSQHKHATWVAELYPPYMVHQSPGFTPLNAKVFPNPVTENQASLEFSLEKSSWVSIRLVDLEGRLVQILAEDRIKSGTHRFQFSTDPLAEGIYLLMVQSEDRILASEKVIVTK